MAHSLQPSAVRNRLLTALPPDVLAQLLPKLRPVSLPLRKVLSTPGKPVEAVYFVESGWVSMVAQMDEGAQAEVGLIGREGLVGVSIITGIETVYVESYVQASGEALQMETKAFQRELDMQPALFRRLLRYNEAMYAQAMQTAACNGRHALEQRLARWILMAHDRADGDDLPLTQEFLGLMLCVHRPSITLVAKMLQQVGIIRYSQGLITVLDRDGLEATACNCYQAVRERFDQILG